jgi:hypothetical protein
MFRYLQKNLFTAPYPLLPLAVFVFFIVCFLLHPFSPIRTGLFSDPDDYMRLDEVINWLQGQGWYDLSQPRMSPGAHTVIHWARLVDLPIALVMMPLLPFMSMTNAALFASFIVPPALFGVLLALVPALAATLVGKDRANLSVLLLMFAPMVVYNFTPGRVDHHGYEILIAGFGLYALHRITNDAKGWPYAIMAAFAYICGLWIGTEALPWLLLFIAALGLIAAWEGGFILANAAIFGAALTVSSLIILPIALPASEFSSRALSWFSPADVIFAALTGGVFVVTWALGRLTENRVLRLSLIAMLGLFALGLMIVFVPDILNGPFADYDSFNSTIALENINEARPLWPALWLDRYNLLTFERCFLTLARTLALPLTACLVLAWQWRKSDRAKRILLLIHVTFLLPALLLTLFWQVRVGYFMQLFSIAPLTWLLVQMWERIGKKLSGRPRFWAELGAFALLGPLPVMLISSGVAATTFYPDMVLFLAARGEESCPLRPAAEFMAETYHGKDITIMAGMNEGPELLFRTPFKLIGGNFNVPGNPDVFDFFNARDDAKAEAIAKKWSINLVLTCRNISPFMAGMDKVAFGKTTFLRVGKDGKLHLSGSPTNPTLIEKLVNDKAPGWLKPVEIPGVKDYLLFEVVNPSDKL